MVSSHSKAFIAQHQPFHACMASSNPPLFFQHYWAFKSLTHPLTLWFTRVFFLTQMRRRKIVILIDYGLTQCLCTCEAPKRRRHKRVQVQVQNKRSFLFFPLFHCSYVFLLLLLFSLSLFANIEIVKFKVVFAAVGYFGDLWRTFRLGIR